MKTIKRMLAVFLAVMVSVSLSPGVFAADEPGAPPADPPSVEQGDPGIDGGGSADPGDENKTEEPSPCLTGGGGISAFGGGVTAFGDGDYFVDIEETDSVFDIQTAIQGAINLSYGIGGGTVTVTGSKTDADEELYLWLYADVKVVWKADYANTNAESWQQNNWNVITIGGTGTFEAAAGTIENVQNGITTIGVGGDGVTLEVTGAAIKATPASYYAINITAGSIKISGGRVEEGIIGAGGAGDITVSGGTVTSAYSSITNTGGDIIVTGGTIESGNQLTLQVQNGDVSVSGGTIINKGPNNNAAAVYAYNGTAKVTGGEVIAENSSAIFVYNGAAAFLEDTCTGAFVVVNSGMIVEAAMLDVPVSYDGTNEDLAYVQGAGEAVWNITGTAVKIDFTFAEGGSRSIVWSSSEPVHGDDAIDIYELYNGGSSASGANWSYDSTTNTIMVTDNVTFFSSQPVTGVSRTLYIGIPDGKKVTWTADYTSSGSLSGRLIDLIGSPAALFEMTGGSMTQRAGNLGLWTANNGVTITVSGGTISSDSNAISGHNVTVKGGSTISGSGIYASGDVTVAGNAKINGGTGYAINPQGAVTISGGTVTSASASVAVYGTSAGITISGTGTEVSNTGAGTAIDALGDVTLTGGTVSATTGIAIVSGDISVSSGTPVTVSRTAANSDNPAIKLTPGSMMVVGNSGELTVNGNVEVSGFDGFVKAVSNGLLTINGDVIGTDSDDTSIVYADMAGTVFIDGDVTVDVGDYSCTGVYAYGGDVTVTGSVTLTDPNNEYSSGVQAQEGGTICVQGDVIVSGAESVGANALSYSEIMVDGDVTVTGSDAVGANAFSGGEITIDGMITAPIYIQVGDEAKTEDDFTEPTTKPDYLTYTDSENPSDTSTVWVLDPAANPVCSIGAKNYGSLAAALSEVEDGETIKLLKNIDYGAEIAVDGISITFDLNGFDLNVETDAGVGLKVRDGGVDITGEGEFNVKSNDNNYWSNWNDVCGIGVFAEGGGTATVTNATGVWAGTVARDDGTVVTINGDAAALDEDSNGIDVYNYATAIVYGDATGGYTGVYCATGASVTIYGDVEGDNDGVYASDATAIVYGEVTGGVNGVYANNADVTIYGNVAAERTSGYSYGINAYGNEASVTVGGNVSTNGSAGSIYGAYAEDGGSVKIGGDVCVENSAGSYACGAYVVNGESSVIVGGNVSASGGANTITGAYADQGSVTIKGHVTANNSKTDGDAYGVCAEESGIIAVGGSVSANGSGGCTYGVWVSDYGTSVTVGGNVSAGGSATDIYGVYTYGVGTSVSIGGNVTAGGSATKIYGVYARYGGSVTVDGVISIPVGATYIYVWGLDSPVITRPDNEVVSSKTGYLEYKGVYEDPPNTYTSYVWVRDPAFKGPVPMASLSISPSHAMLNGADKAVFTAVMANLPEADYSKVVWSVGSGLKIVTPAVSPVTGDSITVEIETPPPADGMTALVTAVYDGIYTATATVEILPSLVLGEVNAKLLESAATVNKAKEIGALVPVHITNEPITATGLSAFARLPGEPDAAGSVVIEDVRLIVTDKSPKNPDGTAVGYTARMYGHDDRYIAIDADDTAKSATVRVELLPKEGEDDDWVDAGPLKLTVTVKYPKITVKAGDLNLAFPDRTAALTATSPEGKCTVKHAEAITPNATKVVYTGWDNGSLKFGGEKPNKGTVKVNVIVYVDGYKPYPYKKTPTVNVKVANALPKIKLSQKAVTLYHGGATPVTIQLLSGDKAPLESNYIIDKVELSDTDAKGGNAGVKNADLEIDHSNGVISINAKQAFPTGKNAQIKVSFEDCAGALYLPLKVNLIADATKLTVSSKVKSAKIHADHATGAKIADIPITLNAANVSYDSGWEAWSDKKGSPLATELNNAISISQGKNSITLSVKDSDALKLLKRDTKYTFNIGHPSIKDAADTPKTVAFTLTVTGKTAGMSVGLKGKIDAANPKSVITGTVKLTNTYSEIESVKLYEQKFDGKYLAAGRDVRSGDFRVAGISGNTFKIMAAHGEVTPNAAQKLSVEVKLKNGQTLRTWGQDSKKKNIDKPITIKPSHKAGKAWQSTKAVTLYKHTPLTGQTVGLHLTTPANVKLGEVRINQASVNSLKLGRKGVDPAKPEDREVFEVIRSGANTWTLRFNDGEVPILLDNKGNLSVIGGAYQTPANKTYNVKLELWAEGSYKKDVDGSFIGPLGTGKTATKPTIVTVKVTIR